MYTLYVSELHGFVPIQWLKDEFLPYLDDWEKSVQARKGKLSKTEKNLMMLSRETLLGLRMTGW